jgi:hypothetical protein
MGELFMGILAGITVSLINKYIINGQIWKLCDGRQEEEDDGLSSQSSAIISDIHVH